MSISDKNEAILAKGEAQRGQFDPEPGSAPVRMYQYWAEHAWVHGAILPTRENFCHYWRVVLIWGPLWFLFMHTLYPIFTSRPAHAAARGLRKIHIPDGIKSFFNKNGEKIVEWMMYIIAGVMALLLLGAVVYNLFTHPANTLIILGIVLGALAVIAGLVAVISYFVEKSDAKKRELRNAQWNAYYRGEGPAPVDEYARKEPGRVKRFFKAVKEYLVVFFNVLRTKKWKICPFVTVPGVEREKVEYNY